jgi:imidazolonepropionase-like amidohydrolase
MLTRYLVLFVLMILSTCNAIAGNLLLLSNANIVDPASSEIRHGHLLIEDKHISKFYKNMPKDFPGKIIDLQGKWIIPGLNDMHTHAGGNRAPGRVSESFGTPATAQLLLSAGVTSFLDLFGHENRLFNQRRLQREGKIGGADIFTSLSCLTATKGHCTEYGLDTRTMDSPGEAKTVIEDLAKRQPDVIKIVYTKDSSMPTITKETLFMAIKTAAALGIKTVIHINSVADMRDAIEGGASAITHLPSDEEVPVDIAELMAAHHVVSIPTIVSDTDSIDFHEDPAILAAPMPTYLAGQEIVNAYKKENWQLADTRVEELISRNQMFYRSTKTLLDAGVVMLTGTDSGGSGAIQGFSVHREMSKLVTSGMSNWQALAAATTNAGKFLGKRFGVNEGDEASLVILNESPIDDIANTQKIAMVIHHGKIIDIHW